MQHREDPTRRDSEDGTAVADAAAGRGAVEVAVRSELEWDNDHPRAET